MGDLWLAREWASGTPLALEGPASAAFSFPFLVAEGAFDWLTADFSGLPPHSRYPFQPP